MMVPQLARMMKHQQIICTLHQWHGAVHKANSLTQLAKGRIFARSFCHQLAGPSQRYNMPSCQRIAQSTSSAFSHKSTTVNLNAAGCGFTARTLCTDSNAQVKCHDLEQRGLLRLQGQDTLTFLQGLITNDTKFIQQPGSTMYAFILNIQGRVLYDLLLYNISKDETTTVLVECDKNVVKELMKMMKMYKIRKKLGGNIRTGYVPGAAELPIPVYQSQVDLSLCEEFQPWAVLPADSSQQVPQSISTTEDVVASATDPRIKHFGWRFIVPSGMQASTFLLDHQGVLDEHQYAERRYQSGLAEGTNELPPGNCFPLESNGNFLNGVSFSKGCYIGQELTSRTHHIGVTRKRIMPIVYTSESHTSKPEDKVENSAGKNSGRVKGVVGKYGIGLLRLPDVLGKKGPLRTMTNEGEVTGEIVTHMPSWWQTDSDAIIQQILTKSS